MRVPALTHSGPVQNRSAGVAYSQQLSVRTFINNNYYSNNTWTKPRGLDSYYPGNDPGIIESRIPKSIFDQHLAPNERPYTGFYPSTLNSTEIVMRTPEQISIFNKYITP